MRNITILIVSCLLLTASSSGLAEGVIENWSLGGFGGYNQPILGLNNWFSGNVKFGITAGYVFKPGLELELEYYHTKYTDGKITKKTFVWGVDRKAYKSPQAQSDMTFNSFLANWLVHFGGATRAFEKGRVSPYMVVGAGFYDYIHKVSGMIYPGQKVEPLNPSIVLLPTEDSKVALGGNIGGGVAIFASPKLVFDFRFRYNILLGHIRPMMAWGLDEVFPLQFSDVGARLKFYFK